MKLKILTVLFFVFSLCLAEPVLAIGIGAKPSFLNLELKTGELEKTKILVYNISKEAAIFEVFPDELKEYITIQPDNFRLEAGETKEVEITLSLKEGGRRATDLSVLAKPLDRASFSVSSGIKIPLRLNIKKAESIFLASLFEAIFPHWIWLLVILIALLFGLSIRRYLKKQKFLRSK